MYKVTYKYRIKNLKGQLRKWARATNTVWNYCNNVQKETVSKKRRWLTGFDLNRLTSGSSKLLNLNAQTICAIGQQYAKSRAQHKRPWLRWRSWKKNLGWVPFKKNSIKQIGQDFKFHGQIFKVKYSRPIPEGAKILDGGSFSQDSLGHWYLNLVLEVPDLPARTPTNKSVGIDLGLKDLATLSDGTKLENPRFYQKLEPKLQMTQRAHKKRQYKKLSLKVKNQRKDYHHKLSTKLIKDFDAIAIGNVSSISLARTNMAKSVGDVGWGLFKTMLQYKAIAHGVRFEEVNESFSTQTCSSCNSRTGPKGLEGLGIRHWTCSSCSCYHDRDTNAALNILTRARTGYGTPVEGA